jgi:hypothetical protein
MKRLLALSLMTVLTLWLAGCGGAGGAATPKGAVETYFNAMKNGDFALMKSVMPEALVAESNKTAGPTAEDSAHAREAMKNLSWEIGEEKMGEDGKTAQVSVKMKFGTMAVDNVIHCVKEASGWKVDITQGAMGMGTPQ